MAFRQKGLLRSIANFTWRYVQLADNTTRETSWKPFERVLTGRYLAQADQWKLSYFEYSITSQIHWQTTVYWNLLDLELLKVERKLKQSLELSPKILVEKMISPVIFDTPSWIIIQSDNFQSGGQLQNVSFSKQFAWKSSRNGSNAALQCFSSSPPPPTQ